MHPSTHIPIVLQTLSHQYADGLAPDLLVFSKQVSGAKSPSTFLSDQPAPLVKAVLVVFEEEEENFLAQLVNYLFDQRCYEVAIQHDITTTYERPTPLRQEGEDCNQPPNFLVPNEAFLVKINSIIEAHLEDEDYRPAMLAKSCFVCEMQLHRKLKKLAQLSPSNYVRKYRMWRSKSFLCDPTLSISEVCSRVGIRSLEYFSRSFRQEFGLSPTMYRTTLSG
ncbi:MAG: helix-turn-helix transcriptional regulator [Saprospiraceae bacterium]|nr:helix-turn-helix transcriptional regulator [Saprospiraceae bacterium]